MMKARSLYFLLVLLLFYFSSCKKENNGANLTFPRKLYVTQLTQKGVVKVYTAKGEITDADSINKFLGKEKFFFNRTFMPDDTSALTFMDYNTAIFSSSTFKYSVTYKDNRFLFTSPQFYETRDPSDIPYLILKYASPLPIISGGNFLANEMRVAYGDYNTLRLSVLSYKLSSEVISGASHRYSVNSAVLFNEFNSAVVNQLKDHDTLAVQESFFTLKSK